MTLIITLLLWPFAVYFMFWMITEGSRVKQQYYNDKDTDTPLAHSVVYPALRLAQSGANDHYSHEWEEN